MKKIAALFVILYLSSLAAMEESATLPDYKVLCDRLADMTDWQASQCEGMKVDNPMMGEFVTASRTYTRGRQRIQVTIVSGIQARMMWSPYAAGTQVENAESLVKITKMNGFPVGITYDKRNRSGGIVVQLGFQAVMAAEFEQMDWQSALKTLQALDWKAMQALFR